VALVDVSTTRAGEVLPWRPTAKAEVEVRVTTRSPPLTAKPPVAEATVISALPLKLTPPMFLGVVNVAAEPVIEPTIALVDSRSVKQPLVTRLPVEAIEPVKVRELAPRDRLPETEVARPRVIAPVAVPLIVTVPAPL